MKEFKFKQEGTSIETKVIHGGAGGIDTVTGAVNVPIYQTSTYRQYALGDNTGWEYSRTGNPTRLALEQLTADLESGKHGYAFGSGMAAITAVYSLFRTGDKILTSSNVYGGTFRVLDKVFDHFGITYQMVDTSDLEAVKASITPDVKAIHIESPANPLLTITDIRKIAEIAKEKGILTIVDNTFMTPYLQRPLELGADIVVHSATKYLNGHCDVVAGLVALNDDDLAEQIAFIQNSTGGVLGPFDSFLLLRGMKTLSVRLDRQVENAEKIAAYLEKLDDIKKIYYPGLKTDPGYEINRSQAKNGGAMMSFELTEDHDIRKFFESLRVIALAESLGGVESLACHPASMTHASIPYEIRQEVGITDGLIRFSPGIESADDLIEDLDQAIKASRISK